MNRLNKITSILIIQAMLLVNCAQVPAVFAKTVFGASCAEQSFQTAQDRGNLSASIKIDQPVFQKSMALLYSEDSNNRILKEMQAIKNPLHRFDHYLELIKETVNLNSSPALHEFLMYQCINGAGLKFKMVATDTLIQIANRERTKEIREVLFKVLEKAGSPYVWKRVLVDLVNNPGPGYQIRLNEISSVEEDEQKISLIKRAITVLKEEEKIPILKIQDSFTQFLSEIKRTNGAEKLKILDVGTGDGQFVRRAKHFSWAKDADIESCDISQSMIEAALYLNFVEVQKMNGAQLAYGDNSLDLVIFNYPSPNSRIKSLSQCFSEIYRVCKNGGGIVFTTVEEKENGFESSVIIDLLTKAGFSLDNIKIFKGKAVPKSFPETGTSGQAIRRYKYLITARKISNNPDKKTLMHEGSWRKNVKGRYNKSFPADVDKNGLSLEERAQIEFTAVVHELANKMTIISGNLESLKSSKEEKLTPEVKIILKINDSLNNVFKPMKTIVRFSQMSNEKIILEIAGQVDALMKSYGQLEKVKERGNLDDSAARALDLELLCMNFIGKRMNNVLNGIKNECFDLKSLIEKKKKWGYLDIENNIDTKLLGYREGMEFVLENLRNNVIVHAKSDMVRHYIRVKKDNNNLVIEFEDAGVGFDIEKIRKLAVELGFIKQKKAEMLNEKQVIDFIFKQGFSQRYKKGKPNGLGLWLCREVIEKCFKGTITADNRKGASGAKFTIRIPKQKSKKDLKSETKIQRYTVLGNDWQLIRKEIILAGRDYFGQGKPASHFWTKIEQSFQSPKGIALVATKRVRGRDKIIGYLAAIEETKDRVYVIGVAVSKEYRQKKIGGRLFKEFVKITKEYGFKKLKIHTDEKAVIRAIESAGCSFSAKAYTDMGSCLFFNIPEKQTEITGPLTTISGNVEMLVAQAI